jgi:hypothetical protein
VDGDEDATILDAAFVALGIVLGDTHAYERSNDLTDCAPNAFRRLVRGGVKEVRKIHREADLATEARAGRVLTSKNTEAEAQSIANHIMAPSHGLKLRFSQSSVSGVSAVNLSSKGERRAKIVLHGKAAWENVSTRCGSQHPGASVASEQISEIYGELGLWR